MIIENLIFCLLAISLRFTVGMKTPNEMSVTEKFILSHATLLGYGLIAWSIIQFGERGHPLFDGIPYLLVTGLLICNFNHFTCLIFWPMADLKSRTFCAAKSNPPYQHAGQSIVVFIPTCGEPISVLRDTLRACKAMEYEHFTVAVLDDSHRQEVKELALSNGCQYFSRGVRDHAKAGNLNYGLSQTDGDFIAVFDADCIPEKNFLKATIHWFSDPNIGIVQTPQFMRMAEPIGQALGVSNHISESDVFYRFNQPVYSLFDAAICCGTACVFRRSSLTTAGGFFSESATEDYYTGIGVAASGYQMVYLYQKLSTGLPATSLASYIEQRKRWARGTIQGLRTSASPFRISGLRLTQRIGHLLSLSSWLREPLSKVLQLTGLGLAIAGLNWINASWQEVILGIIPIRILTTSLERAVQGNEISRRYAALRSAIVDWSIVGSILGALISPRLVEFKVSQKCSQSARSERVQLGAYLGIVFLILMCTWAAHSCLVVLKPYQDLEWQYLFDSRPFFMASASLLYSIEILIVNAFALFVAQRR